MKIKSLFNYKKVILALGDRGFLNFLNDKAYIKTRYYCKFGRPVLK